MTAGRKWRCPECGTVSADDDVLREPSPFGEQHAADTVDGCPHCRVVWGVRPELLCDEPGCVELYVCGWTARDGRPRMTCYMHDRTRAGSTTWVGGAA